MSKGRPSSKEARIAELKARIRPGSIIYLFCDFIVNQHNKYVVIAHIDFENEASLAFLVNSEIRPFIVHDAHLMKGQIELTKDLNYTFLDHDSYINCVEVWDCLDLDFTIHHLLESPDDYKGELKQEEIDKIIAFVKTSQTISKIDQNVIIQSLGG